MTDREGRARLSGSDYWVPPQEGNYNPEVVKGRRRDPLFACELVDMLERRFYASRASAIESAAAIFFMSPEKLLEFYEEFHLAE
jgi:hypothetical protein